MNLDLAMVSLMLHQKQDQQNEKQMKWTSSKLKAFVHPRTLSGK